MDNPAPHSRIAPLESKGRTDEAEQIMKEIQEEVVRDTGTPLPAPSECLTVETTHPAPLRELWSLVIGVWGPRTNAVALETFSV
jgi:hypothetical protein